MDWHMASMCSMSGADSLFVSPVPLVNQHRSSVAKRNPPSRRVSPKERDGRGVVSSPLRHPHASVSFDPSLALFAEPDSAGIHLIRAVHFLVSDHQAIFLFLVGMVVEAECMAEFTVSTTA